jgi:hypothetical protein
VELGTRDIQVRVCSTTNEGAYLFSCPDCQMAVTKSAEPRIVDLLVSSGVRLSVWQLPAELSEPKAGPPISYNDLLEFHFELQHEAWLERMTSRAAVEDRQ